VFKWYLIAWNYAKGGRLFIDAVSIIPYEDVAGLFINNQSTGALKVIGLIKLIRLLRLGRIIRFMKVKTSFKTFMKIG
jgi:hypothetical protein